jgi:hypothetical protein
MSFAPSNTFAYLIACATRQPMDTAMPTAKARIIAFMRLNSTRLNFNGFFSFLRVWRGLTSFFDVVVHNNFTV